MSAKRLSDRTFGLVFSALFGLFCSIGWILTGRVRLWAAVLCGLLLVLALLVPWILMPLNRLWARLGARIALAVNYVALSLFFYGVMLPFGLAGRLRAGGWMRRRPDLTVESYWTPIEREATIETYQDQF